MENKTEIYNCECKLINECFKRPAPGMHISHFRDVAWPTWTLDLQFMLMIFGSGAT